MSTLHITNGDCAAGTLRSFLTDRVLATCDVLHDGPAPLVEGDVWHETRARFLADALEAPYDETRASLARFDRAVADAAEDDEIVLWFEHDLFDQLLLIRTLDLTVRLQARVALICIGEFQGVERFVGLGQLNAEQLASLYPPRQPVGAEQFALAREAWRAFRASDPRELLALMVRLKADATYEGATDAGDASPVASGFSRTSGQTLPFLPGAIQRLFEEYPSTTNGLSRSADAVLRSLDAGPLDGTSLFRATQDAEQRPFIGDTSLFRVIHRLASAAVPLVTIDPVEPGLGLRDRTLRLTDAGRDVLANGHDAVALNGIDEWRGGVHLVGRNRSPWRWDACAETLVS